MLALLAALALAAPLVDEPADAERPVAEADVRKPVFSVLSPTPGRSAGLALPPRVALGLGYTYGGWVPTSGLQARLRPVDRLPLELELAAHGGWSQVSGAHAGGAFGLLARPVLFASRTTWAGFEIGGGVGATSFRPEPWTPYVRAGVSMGWEPRWAPILSIGVTHTRDVPAAPGASITWRLGR